MTKSLESYTYHYLTWQVRMRSLINLADRTHTVRYNNSIIISEKEEQGFLITLTELTNVIDSFTVIKV